MPFWTVEDAGPYKEKSNTLMRTTLCQPLFSLTQEAQRKKLITKKRRENVSRAAEREEGSAPSTAPLFEKSGQKLSVKFLKGARGKLFSKKVSLAPFIYSFSG